MPNPSPVFIGVEILPTAGRVRNSYVYAALDETRELLAIGQGDRDELLAYLGGQAAAIVAVCAPRRLKTGPDKLAEDQLMAQGFPLERTPGMLKGCPAGCGKVSTSSSGWMISAMRLILMMKPSGKAWRPAQMRSSGGC